MQDNLFIKEIEFGKVAAAMVNRDSSHWVKDVITHFLTNYPQLQNAGITVDSDTPTPIYSGPNQAGVKVTRVNGAFISTSAAITPTASQTLIFLDEFHGAGGTTIAGVTFPKGLTIYGRWTMVTPAADADGGIICYFGK